MIKHQTVEVNTPVLNENRYVAYTADRRVSVMGLISFLPTKGRECRRSGILITPCRLRTNPPVVPLEMCASLTSREHSNRVD